MENTAIEFVSFAERRIARIIDESGKVLYSSAETLSKGDIYLLGINPGGVPGVSGTSIRENLQSFSTKTTNDYLDEVWEDSNLQLRVISLLEELGQDVRKVCASNMVFARTKSEPGTAEFNRYADICWPVHEEVIKIVEPKILVVFGSIAYKYLWYRAGKPVEDKGESGYLHPCRAFAKLYGGVSLKVIGIPHMSRRPAKQEAIRFIKNYL